MKRGLRGEETDRQAQRRGKRRRGEPEVWMSGGPLILIDAGSRRRRGGLRRRHDFSCNQSNLYRGCNLYRRRRGGFIRAMVSAVIKAIHQSRDGLRHDFG